MVNLEKVSLLTSRRKQNKFYFIRNNILYLWPKIWDRSHSVVCIIDKRNCKIICVLEPIESTSSFRENITNNRSSHPQVFCKKGVLKNSTKFTGKYLCQRFFFDKVAGLSPAILLKKRLWRRCFTVNFVKYLRTPISEEHL